MQSRLREFDVVVVGSGISGLSCARSIHLDRPDLSVIVLEARNRVGGRLLFENSTDIGGGWIGATQKHCLSAAKELGLELQVQEWPKIRNDVDKSEDLCECCGYDEPPLPLHAKQELERFVSHLDELAVKLRAQCDGEPWKGTETPYTEMKKADAISLLEYMKERMQSPDAIRTMSMICQTVLACEPRDVSMPSSTLFSAQPSH